MSEELCLCAKKVEWEEVTVKGYLSLESNIIEVEKISLDQNNMLFGPLPIPSDSSFELDTLKNLITLRGKLEPAPDGLAS